MDRKIPIPWTTTERIFHKLDRYKSAHWKTTIITFTNRTWTNNILRLEIIILQCTLAPVLNSIFNTAASIEKNNKFIVMTTTVNAAHSERLPQLSATCSVGPYSCFRRRQDRSDRENTKIFLYWFGPSPRVSRPRMKHGCQTYMRWAHPEGSRYARYPADIPRDVNDKTVTVHTIM